MDNEDSNWWASGSQASEQADLYSILVHEMGHALGFEANYPVFGKALKAKEFVDEGVFAYLGFNPYIDPYCHFDRSIDRSSRVDSGFLEPSIRRR